MNESTGRENQSPLALITGASSGIGAAFAERLAGDGYDLILVARREERLNTLADRLRAETGAAVDVLVADLADAGDLQRVEDKIIQGPALGLLVNSAGFGGYRPFLQLDPNQAEELIRLQVIAVTRLTRAALPAMVALGRGAVINVSSQLAFSASLPAPFVPGRSVYAASKAYVNAFTELLHTELAGTGVKVQALCPSIVRTEFHEQMGMDMSRSPVRAMEPAEVVQASLAALANDEVLCLPALSDPSLLDDLRAAERRILEQGRSNTLAQRYQE